MITTSYLTSGKDVSTKWIERGFLVTLFLACLLAMSHHKADPDFWGHVQYGRDAITEGLPDTTTYSYTTDGYRWVNHENLSELLMAAGVSMPGPGGLLAIKSLFALMLMLLIYRQAARQSVSPAPLYISMLLVACNLMHSWTLRPQLMTYTLFALMIALFSWCFAAWPNPWSGLLRNADNEQPDNECADDVPWTAAQGRLRWLWLLPPLFLIWTNAHGGFVAGYCIMAAYLGARSVEAFVAQGRRAWPTVMLLGAIAVVTALVTLINPYGVELHRWLLGSLGASRPEILEWRPPDLLSFVWPTWWLMVAIFVAAILFSRRPRDLTQLAILSLTLWQACEHRRHIAFFAILFGFWMPVHVESLLLRFKRNRSQDIDAATLTPRQRWGLLATLSVVIGVMGVSLLTHLRQIPVRRDSYPVSAFQYIADHHLSGNLIIRFKWAQYAIAAFGTGCEERPHLKVAFDGRFRTCYPQQLVDMYFDFAIGDAPPEMRFRSPDSPPVDGSRILKYKHPDLVLIDREQTYAVGIMQQHQDEWMLLYQDALAQLWGRTDKYDNPEVATYIPPSRRVIGDEPQIGYVAWPALPVRVSQDRQADSQARRTRGAPGIAHVTWGAVRDAPCDDF